MPGLFQDDAMQYGIEYASKFGGQKEEPSQGKGRPSSYLTGTNIFHFLRTKDDDFLFLRASSYLKQNPLNAQHTTDIGHLLTFHFDSFEESSRSFTFVPVE